MTRAKRKTEPERGVKTEHGRLYRDSDNVMFLRVNVGLAKEPGGDEYELTVNAGGYTPIIRNMRTKRWFTMTWPDLIEIARKAGIDQEDTPS